MAKKHGAKQKTLQCNRRNKQKMNEIWETHKHRKPSRAYKCAFCAKKRLIPYRVVDGEKSCAKCNLESMGSIPEIKRGITCPLCKGHGVLIADKVIK